MIFASNLTELIRWQLTIEPFVVSVDLWNERKMQAQPRNNPHFMRN